MKISTVKRRLSEIEAKHYARVVTTKAVEERANEIAELLKMMEMEKLEIKRVARMSEDEKKRYAAEINDYYATGPLPPEIEPYRNALRKSKLRNLGLYDPFHGIATLPESCKEV